MERVKIRQVLFLLPYFFFTRLSRKLLVLRLPDVWEQKGFITHSRAVTNSKTFIVRLGQRARTEGRGFNSL